MSEDNDLVRPDPFWVRLEIANELERVATEVRVEANMNVDRHARAALFCVSRALDMSVSKLRGELGAQADRQSREAEDAREKPFTVARWS